MSDVQFKEEIDLILTDTRESLFKNVKKSERIQKNIDLKGILIDESAPGETFRRLLSKVKTELRFGPEVSFVIGNPDGNLYSPENVTLLRTGDSILVFDHLGQPFPFDFEKTIDTTPHSRAVTSQEWSYHGNPEHNRAAFALGELVDNSLAATANNNGKRTIEIRFYENGPQSFLHVLDNGCGMNSETLTGGLKYKALKVKREYDARNFENADIITNQPNDPADEIHPRYINSNISKFGAGMKACAFCIGRYLRVMTKQKQRETVHDVIYSTDELERRESSHGKEKPWHVTQKSRNPGEVPSESSAQSPGGLPLRKPKSPSCLIKELIGEEIDKKSFTHTILAELNAGESSPLEFIRRSERKGTSIERQLAHMYHYYIHGRDGNGNAGAGSSKNKKAKPGIGVDIIVSRFVIKENAPVLVTSMNLRDIPPKSQFEDLESQFIRTAEDTFLFTIEVSQCSGRAKAKPFKVGGIIRYHAYHFDGETHPEGLLQRKGSMTEDVGEDDGDEGMEGQGQGGGDESDENETAVIDAPQPSTSTNNVYATMSEKSIRKCKDFFHVWWNGRLIPLARLESLDWCSPGPKVGTSHPLYQCYNRISGSLFFDSNVDEITDNKLFISKERLLDIFKEEKRMGGHLSTFQRIGRNKSSRSKRMGAKKEFDEWLKECHKKYDKQVQYYGHSGTMKIKSKEYHIFKQAHWQTKLKEGDAVKSLRCVRGGKPFFIGKVKGFLVDGDVKVEKKCTVAPLSLIQIEQVPEALFGEDVLLTRLMTDIDTSATVNSVQELLYQMENELEMELEFYDWYGEELKEGAQIPMDAILIKDLHIKVKRKVDQKEVLGTLYHPTLTKAKKIIMIARVYKIREDGSRETYCTTKLCQWNNAYKGFFFRAIDLRQTLINQPGDYGITFLSYVDVHEHHLKKQGKGQGSAAALPPPEIESEEDTNLGIADMEQTEAVEEEEGVDDIGRHLLKCGNKLIPMPKASGINFKIIAGTPHKFSIDNIGEDGVEFLIGQPFDITLSFQDAKGNPTKPESCHELVPVDSDKPLVFKAPSSKNAKNKDVNITFVHQDIIPDNDRVIIRGVVASGFLGTEFIDCRVGVRLQWKNKKTETCSAYMVRFSIGLPAQITIVEPSLEIENGSYPSLTCLVKDICGNIVTHHQNKTPIELVCDLFKGKSLKSLKDFSKHFDSIKIKASASENDPQKFHSRINLEELKGGLEMKVRFVCRVSLDNDCEHFGTIPIKVIPSKRPESLRIYFELDQNGNPTKELKPKSEVKLKVKEHLEGMIFKIYDGLGNEVQGDSQKFRLKFDWPKTVPSKPTMKTIFETGILPPMETPISARYKRDCTTTLVSADEQNPESPLKVVHRFYLTTEPYEPCELKVNVKGHPPGERVSVKIDELMNLEILTSVLDRHGNALTDFKDYRSLMELQTENLDSFIVFVTIPCADDRELSKLGGSFMLRQIQFFDGTPPPPIGDRDFFVKFGQNLKATLPLKLLPGKPTSLAFEIDGEVQTAVTRNVNSIPSTGDFKILNQTNARVQVHLKDAFGNSVRTPGKSLTLSVSQKMVGYEGNRSLTALTNSEGVGDFKLVNIGVKPEEVSASCRIMAPGQPCHNKCYNLHYLIAKLDDLTFHCCLHIKCRPDVPKRLYINCGQLVCTAGCKFEDFMVILKAEDDSTVTRAKLEDLELTMMTTQNNICHLKPRNVHNGVYSFGTAPEVAGEYSLEFSFNDGITSFKQRYDGLFRICCSVVNSLEPEGGLRNDGIICVSNDPGNRARRTILTKLNIVLKDKYKNGTEHLTQSDLEAMEDCLNGKIKIAVVGENSHRIRFHNPGEIFTPIPLNDGIAMIPDIILRPETNLPNNSKFDLKFTATLRNHEKYVYTVEFTFYNDIAQQNERQRLEASKATLEKCVKGHEQQFELYREELKKLQTEEQKVRWNEEELRRKFPTLTSHIDLSTGIALRECHLLDKQRSLERGRRGTETNVEQFGQSQTHEQVLGVIGHLVQIKSENGGIESDIQLQTVMSWHLQKYLPVIVALTTHKGLEIESRYKRRVMLLDSLRSEMINWNEEIPLKLRRFGNPKYARSLLHLMTTDCSKIQHIQKVFNVILGRTIIVNTQEDAANYRKEYLSGGDPGRCPTIITRDGRRIGTDAVIGGSENRAPSLDRLSYKFGLGPSDGLIQIGAELKGLNKLREALKLRIQAEKCREDYVEKHRERMEKVGEELTRFNTDKDEVEFKLVVLNDERQSQNQNYYGWGEMDHEDMEVTSTTSAGIGMTPRKYERTDEDGDGVPRKRSRY